jgi:uncharacterized protein
MNTGLTSNSGLRINVAGLLKGPIGAVRRFNLLEDIAGIDQHLDIQSPLVGSLTLIRTPDGVLASASAETSLELECCRCLEPFSGPVQLEIEEEFHPSVDIGTGASLPVTDTEQDATVIDEHHVLDLTEVVRQAILLSLPMSPLCQQDCAGLCPLCGQNLNESRCQCATDAVDPRLEVLKQLL